MAENERPTALERLQRRDEALSQLRGDDNAKTAETVAEAPTTASKAAPEPLAVDTIQEVATEPIVADEPLKAADVKDPMNAAIMQLGRHSDPTEVGGAVTAWTRRAMNGIDDPYGSMTFGTKTEDNYELLERIQGVINPVVAKDEHKEAYTKLLEKNKAVASNSQRLVELGKESSDYTLQAIRGAALDSPLATLIGATDEVTKVNLAVNNQSALQDAIISEVNKSNPLGKWGQLATLKFWNVKSVYEGDYDADTLALLKRFGITAKSSAETVDAIRQSPKAERLVELSDEAEAVVANATALKVAKTKSHMVRSASLWERMSPAGQEYAKAYLSSTEEYYPDILPIALKHEKAAIVIRAQRARGVAFAALNESDKRAATAYISHIKPVTDVNAAEQLVRAGTDAMWNFVGGAAEGAVDFTGQTFILAPLALVKPEEAGQLAEDLKEFRRDESLMAEMRVAKYPERGLFFKGVNGFVESAPYMAAVSIPGLNVMGIPMAFSGMTHEIRSEILKRNPNASPEMAYVYAGTGAALSIMVEKIQGAGVLGKGFSKAAIADKLSARMGLFAKQFAIGVATEVPSNFLEELGQVIIEETATQFGVGEVELSEITRVVEQAIDEIAPTMVAFGVVGGSSRGFRSVAASRVAGGEGVGQLMSDAVDQDATDAAYQKDVLDNPVSEDAALELHAIATENWAAAAKDGETAQNLALADAGVANVDAAHESLKVNGEALLEVVREAKTEEQSLQKNSGSVLTVDDKKDLHDAASAKGFVVDYEDVVTDANGAMLDAKVEGDRVIVANDAKDAQKALEQLTAPVEAEATVEAPKVVPKASKNLQYDVTAAATAMMLKKQTVDADVITALAGGKDVDTAAVIADATAAADAVLTDAVQRVDYAAAKKAAAHRMAYNIIKDGVTAGEKLGAARAKLRQAAKEQRELAEQRKLRQLEQHGVTAKKLQEEHGVSAINAAADGTLFDNTKAALTKKWEGLGIKEDNAVAKRELRGTLANAVRSYVNSVVPRNVRFAINNEIAKFQRHRTADSYDNIQSQLDAITTKANALAAEAEGKLKKSELTKTLKKLLKSKNRKVLLENKERTISKPNFDVAAAVDKAVRLSAEKVGNVLEAAGSIIDSSTATPVELDEAIKTITDALPSLNTNEWSDTDKARIAAWVVSNFGDYKSLSLADKVAANEAFEDFLLEAEGSHLKTIRKDAELRDKLNKELGNLIDEGIELTGPVKSGGKLLFSSFSPFKMLERLEGLIPPPKEGEVSATRAAIGQLRVALSNSRQRKQGRISEMARRAHNKIKSLYTPEQYREFTRDQDEFAKFSNDGETPISRATLLNLWLGLSQPDVQERAEKAGNEKILRQIGMLPEISNALTDSDMELAVWMRDEINNILPALQESFKRITGAELQIVDALYFPTVTEGSPAGFSRSGGGVSLLKGFMKARVPHNRALADNVNAIGVFESHINDAIQFIEYADTMLLYRDTMFSEGIAPQLERLIGKRDFGIMRDAFSDEIAGKIIQKGPVFPTIDKIRAAFVIKSLFGNIFTVARQVVDFTALASSTGITDFVKNMGTMFTDDGIEATNIMLKHPAIISRLRDGYNVHIIHAMEEANKLGPEWLKATIRTGMKFPQWGDAASVAMVAGATYRAMLKRPEILAIADDAERQEAAANLAVTEIELMLQSPHPADLPSIVRSGGTLGKLVGTFKSALTPKVADAKQAYDEARARKDFASVKKLGRKLAVHWVMAGLLQGMVNHAYQLGFSEEEVENDEALMSYLTSMLAGPMGGIILFGDFAEAMISTMVEDRNLHGRGGGPLSGLFKDAMEIVDPVKELDEKGLEEVTQEAMLEILENASNPTKLGVKLYKKNQ